MLIKKKFWQLCNIYFINQCICEEDIRCDAEDIPNREACDVHNLTWKNSEVHFDHVGMAYLALFQVATWKGWIQIMNDAIDTTGVSLIQSF